MAEKRTEAEGKAAGVIAAAGGGTRWNGQQQEALDAEGRIIVSASAGSGKTAVMVERMQRKILAGSEGGGCEADQVLALTFTKMAAAQMRDRIEGSLIERINDTGVPMAERERLKGQLALLPSAQISTIHAFCANLIRSYFYMTGNGTEEGVDVSFEIMTDEDPEMSELKSLAMDGVFADGYGSDRDPPDPDFMDLLNIYYRKKDDRLSDMLFELYGKLRVQEGYRTKLEQAVAGDGPSFDTVCENLLADAKDRAGHMRAQLEGFAGELDGLDAPKTSDYVQALIGICGRILSQEDYFGLCGLAAGVTFPDKRKKDASPRSRELLDAAGTYCDALKDLCAELKDTADRKTELARFGNARGTAGRIAKYLLKYDGAYTRCKRARGKLDYSDLEHIALRLLQDETMREETRKRYRYVFVDEYQDVNPLQDAIIRQVAGENLFLVGDVKQSIYRFRGSSSRYFSERWEQFRAGDSAVRLDTNYRSCKKILDAVNDFFRGREDPPKEDRGAEEAGGPAPAGEGGCGRDVPGPFPGRLIPDYEDMTGGSACGPEDGRVEAHIFWGSDPKEETGGAQGVYSVRQAYGEAGTGAVKPRAEILAVWDVIERELGRKIYDRKEKRCRNVRYGDIAVLAQKMTGTVPELVKYLTEVKGVPVTSTAKVNLCDFSEIRQLQDILSIIDNPMQDIPLCSALLSGMGDLTDDDLAEIALSGGETLTFCGKAKKRSEEGDALGGKLKLFYDCLERYKNLAQLISAAELLERLLAEKGIEAGWLARPNGTQRLAHIQAFIACARGMTVHEFLIFLKGVNGEIFVTENGGEGALRVATMHASKGLEYPVVILTDLAGRTQTSSGDDVYYSEAFGLAPRCYDRERRLRYDTLQRRVIRAEERRESLKDRINLLYVAMTRAEYALHIVLSGKEAKKYADPYLSETLSGLLERETLMRFAVLEEREAGPGADAQETADAGVPAGGEAPAAEGAESKGELVREIRDAFSFVYPYPLAESGKVRVKGSATSLVSRESPPEGEDLFYDGGEDGNGGLPMTGERAKKSEIGTAYHAFLEHADFHATDGAAELDRLVADGLLSEEQSALLGREEAGRILSMPLFGRLAGASLLLREVPFTVQLPANEIYPTGYAEPVLFQGRIDLLAQTDAGIEIYDYKFSELKPEAILKRYGQQARLYVKAVRMILDRGRGRSPGGLSIPEDSVPEIRFAFVNIRHGDVIGVPDGLIQAPPEKIRTL